MSLERIADLVRERTGLDPAALGPGALAAIVDARRKETGAPGVDAYAARLPGDADEVARLAQDLLVHETSFFRYPASYSLLAAAARVRLAARGDPLRVLSAGCALGSEPASVVMTLLDAGAPPERILVDAVDLGEAAIARARRGEYGARELRGLTPETRARHFEAGGPPWRLESRVLQRICYRVEDLLANGAAVADLYDVVLCRSVVIYLTPQARARLLSNLRRRLRPDGLLFVGHAETLAVRSYGWTPIAPLDAYALRIAPEAKPAPRRAFPAPPPAPLPQRPTSRTGSARGTTPARSAPTPPHAPPVVESSTLERARALGDAGRLDEARALLEAEAAGSRPSADVFCLLAVVHHAAGRTIDAENALIRALYLDPRHHEALLLSALLAGGRGDSARAARLFERARKTRGAGTPT